MLCLCLTIFILWAAFQEVDHLFSLVILYLPCWHFILLVLSFSQLCVVFISSSCSFLFHLFIFIQVEVFLHSPCLCFSKLKEKFCFQSFIDSHGSKIKTILQVYVDKVPFYFNYFPLPPKRTTFISFVFLVFLFFCIQVNKIYILFFQIFYTKGDMLYTPFCTIFLLLNLISWWFLHTIQLFSSYLIFHFVDIPWLM